MASSGRGRENLRKWAVDLGDASNSNRDFPDPPGFSRVQSDLDEGGSKLTKVKEVDAQWKQNKAWEVAQAPMKNMAMMAFMMWMAGTSIHLFSIGIVVSVLWQPINALRNMGKLFEPFRDPRTDTLTPMLLYTAMQLGGLAIGLWKLSVLGVLPTRASDWLSSLPPRPPMEHATGGILL